MLSSSTSSPAFTLLKRLIMDAESSLRLDPEFKAFLEDLRRTTAALEAAMRESARLTGQDTEQDRRTRTAA